MPAFVAQPQTIDVWLRALGLERYVGDFERAGIDCEVLNSLTDADLKDVGVGLLGHRRKILARLSKLGPPEPGDLPEAERRYLTVVFCDMVGSTRLAEQLGAEDFAEILDAFYRGVEAATARFGGHVAQYHGDGVLIYFGYPNAVEDAAVRAVHAASEMVEAVGKISFRGVNSIAARCGVASGLVVLDNRRNGGSGTPGRAYGLTVNLAARVQAQSEDGTVAIAHTTARLVRDQVELTSLGTHLLKGIDTPCTLYRPTAGGVEGIDRKVPHPRRPGDFIGRHDELRVLQACWNDALGGAVAVLPVIGEAGIGKSRLVSEFVTQQQAQGHPVRIVASHAHQQEMPFLPFLRPLKHAAAEGDPEAANLLALLQEQPAADAGGRRQRREEMRTALARYFAARPGDRPGILWFEDFHWADPSTAETLRHIAMAAGPGLLILVCCRGAAELAALEGIGREALQVPPLSAGETRQIISTVLGQSAFDEETVVELAARAEGVPIFAEELALDLRERASDPDSGADAEDAGRVPSSLQQILQARIARLRLARPLVFLTACIGRSAAVPILRQLWPPGDTIEGALDELIRSGLGELRLARRPGEEDLLVLRHQLIRDCAYELILRRDRIRIHSSVADALEWRVQRGQPVEIATRAEHLERALRTREAAEFWAEAGQDAALRSADVEAAALFRRALAILSGVDDPEWTDTFEADTLLSLYQTLLKTQGYRVADPEIARRLERQVARVGGSHRVFSSVFLRWLRLLTQGEIDTAHDFALGLSRVVDTDESGLQQMTLHRMIGSTFMFRGEFDEARRHLDAFLALYDAERHEAALRQFGVTDNHTTVLCCFSAIEAFSGSDESSDAAVRAALSAAEATCHAHTICHTLAFGAALPAAIRGDWAALGERTAQLTRVATEHKLGFWLHFAKILDGIRQVSQGAGEAGVHDFDLGVEALRAAGFAFLMPSFRTLLLNAHPDDRPPSARDMTEIEQALHAGERWLLPLCRSLRARGCRGVRS